MFSYIYNDRKSYLKYDDNLYIVYLDEEVIPDYVETYEMGIQSEPHTAYRYTGQLHDGGTLIECTSGTRNDLINGIIRSKYSQTEEDAIKTHQIQILKDSVDQEKAAEYNEEWAEFNEFRQKVIAQVDKWLEA